MGSFSVTSHKNSNAFQERQYKNMPCYPHMWPQGGHSEQLEILCTTLYKLVLFKQNLTLRIHPLGTKNVCTKYHVNPLELLRYFESGPKCWTGRLILPCLGRAAYVSCSFKSGVYKHFCLGDRVVCDVLDIWGGIAVTQRKQFLKIYLLYLTEIFF